MTRLFAIVVLVCSACIFDPHMPEPVDDPSLEECEGVPSIGIDDPCCAVHQCLLDAGVEACAEQKYCNSLVVDAVCGDQVCNGIECSSCVGPV